MSRARPELLIAVKGYWPHIGGVEEAARRLADGVAASGALTVTVLAVSDDRQGCDLVNNGVRVIKLPLLMRPLSTPFAAGYSRTLRRLAESADVIHLHSPWPPGELAVLDRRIRKPLVVTWHFDIVRQRFVAPLYRPLADGLFERSHRIVCSNPNLPATSPWLAHYNDRVTVIPFGVDAARWDLKPGEDEQIRLIRQSHRRPLVLFVGRLVYYKGIDILLHAASKIDIDLAIVGSGPLREKLQKLTHTLSISDRVSFLGSLPDTELRCHYHACDLFVLPSVARSEAFGLVLLEAMCAGKPLVTTELGTGTSWINQHDQTGLVVPAGDPSALANAIERIVGDENLARRYGSAARERVLSVFNEQQYTDSHLTLYRSLIAG